VATYAGGWWEAGAARRRLLRHDAEHVRAIAGFVATRPSAPRDGREAQALGRIAAAAAAAAAPPGGPAEARTPPAPRRAIRPGRALAAGTFVRTVEIVPPRGPDPAVMIEQARALWAAGVDAVNVPDGPRAQSRMGALMSGLLIEREAGIEAIVHYTCRDRNFLGMLSDALGAAAVGLPTCCRHGRPPKDGPYRTRRPSSTRLSGWSASGPPQPGPRPGGNAMTPATRLWSASGQPGGRVPDREIRRLPPRSGRRRLRSASRSSTRPARPFPPGDRGFGSRSGGDGRDKLRNAEFLANGCRASASPATLCEWRPATGPQCACRGVAIARELTAIRRALPGQVAAPSGGSWRWKHWPLIGCRTVDQAPSARHPRPQATDEVGASGRCVARQAGRSEVAGSRPSARARRTGPRSRRKRSQARKAVRRRPSRGDCPWQTMSAWCAAYRSLVRHR
jgi:homocysteine S-methyltransferase